MFNSGLEKSRDQIANIHWIIEKAREFQKNIYFHVIDYAKAFDCVQFSSVAQLCPTLCNPKNRSTPGLPVHHQLLEFTQTHVLFDCVDHNKLWNILKEIRIPDHLICLLRNLYACQEAAIRTVHGTMDSFQIGKGVYQGSILSPCLFNFYAEYIMQNAGLNEAQAGIMIPRRSINNLR